MTSLVRFIITCVVLLAAGTTVGAETHFFLEPGLKYSFGKTEYIMDILAQDPDLPDLVKLKSQLEFPLDAVLVGGKLGVDFRSGTIPNWVIMAEIYSSTNNPSGKFIDHDWWDGPTGVGVFNGKFSYTESEVEGDNLIAAIEVNKNFLKSERSRFFLRAGYRYQRIEQTALGYTGWQIDIFNDPDFIAQAISEPSIEAIKYRVTYSSPFAGFAWQRQARLVSLEIKSAAMLMFVDDFDDHLLRGKEAVANGTGYAFSGEVGLRYFLFGLKPGLPYLDIGSSLFYTSSSTKQTQRWYEAEGDIPAGYTESGIPHDINSLQYSLRFSVGIFIGGRMVP